MQPKKFGRKPIKPEEKKVPVYVFVKAKNIKKAKAKLLELAKEFNQ